MDIPLIIWLILRIKRKELRLCTKVDWLEWEMKGLIQKNYFSVIWGHVRPKKAVGCYFFLGHKKLEGDENHAFKKKSDK